MNQSVISGLIYNAALLLSLGIIYDTLSLLSKRISLLTKALTGCFLALVIVAIMANPWVIKPGIVFDTRSILLSLVGMFMGIIPISIAVGVALIFRIFQGGGGVYMGCSVIVSATLLGLIWKKLHRKWKRPFGFWELYSLGIATHITMLALTSLLPCGSKWEVLSTIGLPVIIIYPIATVLLGQVMALRIKRNREKTQLQQNETQFRGLYENAPMPYQSLGANGKFLIVNQAWLDTLGYEFEDVIGHNFSEFMHPDSLAHYAITFPKFKAAGYIDGVEFILLKKDGSQILVSYNGKIINDAEGNFIQTQCLFTDITEHRKQEAALRSIEWMLTKQSISEDSPSSYGNLTEMNTCRLILDSVGKDVLQELVSEYLSLMDTSSAVYEKNGDYAVGIFSSSWCQYMDTISRNLCNTEDNKEALTCGKWLCHESCWTDVSKKVIETGETIDLECNGGLRLYAVPIRISSGIIGAINFGYGTPPTDDSKLQELADKYQVDLTELKKKAKLYQTRPAFIIEQAKRKLHSAARIIGEIVERKLAEEELKQSRADWESIFQSIPHPTYVLDKDQNVIAANVYLEKAVGLNSAEMKGRKCWELMHGEGTQEPPFGCPFAESCEQDNNNTGEMEMFALGGWYIVSCKPIYDKHGNIDKVIHIAMDITARKKAELVLAESEEKYRVLTETAQDSIIVHHFDGSVSYANPKALEFWGITASELSTINIVNYVAPEYHALLHEQRSERLAGCKEPRIFQVELISGSKQRHQAEVSSTPIISNGEITGMMAVVRDITERIMTEEQRNRYAHRLEILREIDSIVLETLSFDLVCNAAAKSLQELIPFTLLSVNVLEESFVRIPALLKPDNKYSYLSIDNQYPVNMDFMDVLKQHKTLIINDLSQEPHPSNMPVRAQLMDEGVKSVMYSAMIMQDELVGFLWFCSDKPYFFTEEHREIANEFANQLAIVLHQLRLIEQIKEHNEELELKVEERTEQLKSANQELESFSYSVAHDLRSPLRTIDGYCNIFMEDHLPQLPQESIDLLNTIRSTTHRMDTLINELLELAKLNRDSLKLNQVNMQNLATRICSAVIQAKSPISFEIQIEDIPNCIADETLISQVWQNLLENAVKFTAPRELRQIQIGSQKREYDTVYFVRDSGVGFEMQYVDKIFKAFQRLHREKEFEGTGIGLAIVKKVIDRHDGKVWAESTVGKGTTIYFSIPDVIG